MAGENDFLIGVQVQLDQATQQIETLVDKTVTGATEAEAALVDMGNAAERTGRQVVTAGQRSERATTAVVTSQRAVGTEVRKTGEGFRGAGAAISATSAAMAAFGGPAGPIATVTSSLSALAVSGLGPLALVAAGVTLAIGLMAGSADDEAVPAFRATEERAKALTEQLTRLRAEASLVARGLPSTGSDIEIAGAEFDLLKLKAEADVQKAAGPGGTSIGGFFRNFGSAFFGDLRGEWPDSDFILQTTQRQASDAVRLQEQYIERLKVIRDVEKDIAATRERDAALASAASASFGISVERAGIARPGIARDVIARELELGNARADLAAALAAEDQRAIETAELRVHLAEQLLEETKALNAERIKENQRTKEQTDAEQRIRDLQGEQSRTAGGIGGLRISLQALQTGETPEVIALRQQIAARESLSYKTDREAKLGGDITENLRQQLALNIAISDEKERQAEAVRAEQERQALAAQFRAPGEAFADGIKSGLSSLLSGELDDPLAQLSTLMTRTMSDAVAEGIIQGLGLKQAAGNLTEGIANFFSGGLGGPTTQGGPR